MGHLSISTFSKCWLSYFRISIKIVSKYAANNLPQFLTPEAEDQTQVPKQLTKVNLAVKPAGPHQGWIKDVRAVSAGQYHHIGSRVEPWTENQVSPRKAWASTSPCPCCSPLLTPHHTARAVRQAAGWPNLRNLTASWAVSLAKASYPDAWHSIPSCIS